MAIGRWWTALLLWPAWAGCAGGEADDCRRPDDAGLQLGLIPADGDCVGCGFDVEGDLACEAAYPDVPDGCAAYCREWMCWTTCPGQRCWTKVCDPGLPESCAEPSGDYAILYPCDPECGVGGACRHCDVDSQCEADLGPTAICERHCGTCCRPEDNYDGPYPCLCV